MADKVSVPTLASMHKSGSKIVCITAYDFTFGEIADQAGADVILVGDSLGNVVMGFPTTIPVTLEQMIHHTRATSAGVKRALLVADLPFGSYNASCSQAVSSAVALMQAGASAVKLEGEYLDEIRALTKAGIPVMGHVGYTPQSANRFGPTKRQGKSSDGSSLIDSCLKIADAGAFAIVLELIPESVAGQITEAVGCPTIGIGAGPHCSGQVQVLHDVLGLSEFRFKHAMREIEGRTLFKAAIGEYASKVRSGRDKT
jgi:3-methyl-2-oxobutanoate hydroxymethyltransferase